MLKQVAAGLLAFISFAPAGWATTCGSVPNTFSSGTSAVASAVNTNFSTIYNCSNTSLAPLASPSFTGNVGIGTPSPTQSLSVNAAMNLDQAGTNSGSSLDLSFGSGSGEGIGSARVSGTNEFGLNFFTSNYLRFAITQIGYVGVGTATPSLLFTVNGSAGGTSAWQTISDERLKKNIEPVSDALDLVQRLHPVRYHWRAVGERRIGKTLKLGTSDPQIGFLAQEVAAVVPEAAVVPKKGSNEPYGLREDNLIPILVEAVKEQQTEIEQLRASLASLKSGKSTAQ